MSTPTIHSAMFVSANHLVDGMVSIWDNHEFKLTDCGIYTEHQQKLLSLVDLETFKVYVESVFENWEDEGIDISGIKGHFYSAYGELVGKNVYVNLDADCLRD